ARPPTARRSSSRCTSPPRTSCAGWWRTCSSAGGTEAMEAVQPAQAVILVGGLGTRLGARTAHMPKPLLEVGGKPFLEHLVEEIARHGLRRILLLARYHADKIAAFAAASPTVRRLGLSVETALEPEGAGTAGALWHARDRLDPLFLLLNGDSW